VKLADSTAVITGAASGIGLACAELFLAEGARVAMVDRDQAALASAAERLTVADERRLLLAGDVGDEATVRTQAQAINDQFGGIDSLIACAGFSTGTSVPDTTLAQWDAVLRTNLTGSFLWARAVLPAMRATGGGSIVFISSQLATAGGRNNAPYLASKGALTSLARSMANDHAAEGVRVNCVVPGAIDTPLLRRAFARQSDPEQARQRSVSRHPLGRLGKADEVARACLFLASDDASFTTGASLPVDGGWLAG
jgi:NAD(P)-dependent dehydrogenase (short-subunit alcohol dehydrogenase family)